MHLQEILKAPQRTLSVEILKLIVLGSFSCQMYVLRAESYLEANIHGPSEPHISRTHVHSLSLSLALWLLYSPPAWLCCYHCNV